MPIDNVADLIAETLIQAGVKRVFGVVGDSLNGLTEALRKLSLDDLDQVLSANLRSAFVTTQAVLTKMPSLGVGK